MFALLHIDISRRNLSGSDFRVLIAIAAHANKSGAAWPSIARISDASGLPERSVLRALSRLENDGLILRAKNGIRNVYTIASPDHPEQPLDMVSPAPAPEPVAAHTPVRAPDPVAEQVSAPTQPRAQQPVATPAPQPVVAKNATTAKPAPAQVSAPAPEPVREPAPVAEQVAAPAPKPAPAIAQPTDDNLSHVAKPEEQDGKPEELPAKPEELEAKHEELPAPTQPRAQQPVAKPQPAPAPVSVAPMPALEPLPPAPRRNIVSARVDRLPDVDEAVRREVEARPIIRSSAKPIDAADPELRARALKLQARCAENTARSREQKAAAQRFEDGVTAATAETAAAVAAQDIAAARQRAAQDAAAAKPEQLAAQDAAAPTPAPVATVTDQKPEQLPAKTEEQAAKTEELPAKTEEQAAAAEKITDGQNADAARDSAAREGCYPAGGKTNAPEPVPAETAAQPAPDTPAAPEPVATAPIVLPAPVAVQESPAPASQPALPIICEPQPPAATPQQGELLRAAVQGELLPAPVKPSNAVALNGELLPVETKLRKTRLPKDWQLPRKWGEWAMEEYGFTEDEVRFHAKQFYRHWVSSASPNAYRVSWYLAWQKWMGDEHQKKQRYNNRPQQKSKTLQIIESFAKKYNGDFGIPF